MRFPLFQQGAQDRRPGRFFRRLLARHIGVGLAEIFGSRRQLPARKQADGFAGDIYGLFWGFHDGTRELGENGRVG